MQAEDHSMSHAFTLEYWRDGPWFVGRLVEVPSVFSQGETLDELRENIQEAYDLCVTQEREPAPVSAMTQELELVV
jgi:predicted RNase H-like HicB family nuclease